MDVNEHERLSFIHSFIHSHILLACFDYFTGTVQNAVISLVVISSINIIVTLPTTKPLKSGCTVLISNHVIGVHFIVVCHSAVSAAEVVLFGYMIPSQRHQ